MSRTTREILAEKRAFWSPSVSRCSPPVKTSRRVLYFASHPIGNVGENTRCPSFFRTAPCSGLIKFEACPEIRFLQQLRERRIVFRSFRNPTVTSILLLSPSRPFSLLMNILRILLFLAIQHTPPPLRRFIPVARRSRTAHLLEIGESVEAHVFALRHPLAHTLIVSQTSRLPPVFYILLCRSPHQHSHPSPVRLHESDKNQRTRFVELSSTYSLPPGPICRVSHSFAARL